MKQPKIAALPAREKQPGLQKEPDDVHKNDPISWGLGRVDFHGAWGWLKLDREHLDELHQELVKLEGKTLHKLLQTKKVKDIPTVHMKREAQQRLKDIDLEEHDTVWELRLPGKRRAWGLVERSVFQFLWWDPLETACNPPPKGTRRR
jgi:hypothetical protein